MSSKVKKTLVGDNICFTIGIIFIILIALCGVWAYSISKTNLDEPKHLYKIDNSYEYVYVNGNDYPIKFASDDTYYYAFVPFYFEDDGKTYYDATIAAFKKDKYEDIIKAYDEADDNDEIITDGVSYIGVSKYIDTELRELAYDSYPEIFEDDITESEFDDFFGSYYILVDESPIDYTAPICMAITLLIIGGYFIYRGISSKIRNKKIMDSDLYMKASMELDSPLYETKKAILTNNYIIYADAGIKIIPYSDITWVYSHTFRYNGVPNHSVAYYVKGSKKKHLISYGLNEKIVNEIVLLIGDKNKDTLVGYTKENKKLYKEIV